VQHPAVNADIIKVILRQIRIKQSDRDVVFDGFRHLGSRGKAQHQQLTGNASSAQGKRLFDTSHANPGRAAGNGCLGCRAGAVAIAIGFDHSHYLHPGLFPDQSSIVLDGFKVNLQPG